MRIIGLYMCITYVFLTRKEKMLDTDGSKIILIYRNKSNGMYRIYVRIFRGSIICKYIIVIV
jgi:hypothetical protein